ncbi:hypothetical protein MPSEU_000984400 [Mayamaea pseudoterrestris]|nr:hypothetical protein MPSEU_000984400 [Mayamaea pseudoterrestris]
MKSEAFNFAPAGASSPWTASSFLLHPSRSVERRGFIHANTRWSSSQSNSLLSKSAMRLQDLEHQSKRLLAETASHSDLTQRAQIQDLLVQWRDALLASNHVEEASTDSDRSLTVADALERMHDLYQVWQNLDKAIAGTPSSSSSDSPSSSLPHRVMLQVYAHVAQLNDCESYSTRALQVMNDWNETLGGDLELAASLDDYHLLLRVFRSSGKQKQNAAIRSDDCNTMSKAAALAESSDSLDAKLTVARIAMEVLEHLQETGYYMTPTLTTYALVSDCLANVAMLPATGGGNTLAGDEVMSIRTSMLQTIKQADGLIAKNKQTTLQKEDLLRHVQILCNGLDCLCQSSDQGIATNVWTELLWRLRDVLASSEKQAEILAAAAASNQQTDLCERFIKTLTRVLQASTLLSVMEREDVVKALLEPLRSMYPNDLPTLHLYYLAILAFKGAEFSTSSKAYRQELLELMEAKHITLRQSNVVVDSDTDTFHWNLLMEANYDADKPHRVSRLWKEMTSNPKIRRNSKSFSVQLKALAKIGTAPAAQQAMGIWQKTLEKEIVTLSAHDYASVMVAWSRSRHPQASAQCQRIFDRLKQQTDGDANLKPSVVHYTTLILTDNSMTPNKAKQILDDLRGDGVEPDLRIYQVLFKSLSRLGTAEAAETIENLLNEMQKNKTVTPDLPCLVSSMYAWSSVSDGHVKCELILDRLETLTGRGDDSLGLLGAAPYQALIAAWIHNNPSIAGQEADKILDRVKRASRYGIAHAPDKKLYSSVMTAHLKSNLEIGSYTLDKLEELMREMTDANESGNHAAKPDARCTTILIHAYAKSNHSNKAAVAWGLLQRLMKGYQQRGDLDSKPSAHAFAAVLNACAYTHNDHSQDAVHIALQVMTALTDGSCGVKPNSYIYVNFFQVIGRHLANMDERNRIAGVILQRCSAEGFVSSRVLAALREFVPELYRKLPKDPTSRRISLPAQWTRHT